MTRIFLAWVAGEISLSVRADEPEVFADLLEELKNQIAPPQRRYSPPERTWFIAGDVFIHLSTWIDYAQNYHSAKIEWSTAKDSGEQQHRTRENRARASHAPVKGDAYATLFLLPTAPPELVKAAYKTLSLKLHPDKPGGDVRAMQQLNAAYSSLTKAA
jgi:hypothetical protein